MGYDVHLTRAAFWAMNDDARITPEEWLELVNEDNELLLTSGGDAYVAQWIHDSGSGIAYFEWFDGNVQVKDPTRAAIEKLEALAVRLGARVQGDDGELYRDGQVTLE